MKKSELKKPISVTLDLKSERIIDRYQRRVDLISKSAVLREAVKCLAEKFDLAKK